MSTDLLAERLDSLALCLFKSTEGNIRERQGMDQQSRLPTFQHDQCLFRSAERQQRIRYIRIQYRDLGGLDLSSFQRVGVPKQIPADRNCFLIRDQCFFENSALKPAVSNVLQSPPALKRKVNRVDFERFVVIPDSLIALPDHGINAAESLQYLRPGERVAVPGMDAEAGFKMRDRSPKVLFSSP